MINKEESLRQILQFYYGLRCAFLHRSAQMTFKRGALANFPSGDSAIKLIVEHKTGEICESAIKTVQRSLVELYEKIKANRMDADIRLCDLQTMVSLSMCYVFDHQHDQLAHNVTDLWKSAWHR